MMMRIADWHGVQAANAYREWISFKQPDAFYRFVRHTHIADMMWS